ncbi:MAG: hypothetical protein R3C58_01395 [Parvularculaceae bacterium]
MPKLLWAVIAASALSATTATAAPAAETARSTTAVKSSVSKTQLLNGLKPADDISPRLAKIKASITALGGPKATKQSQARSLKAGLKEIDLLDQSLLKLRGGFEKAEASIGSYGGPDSVDSARNSIEALRKAFEEKLKDLESEDKLGNFEIQDLMSRYNQSETLASSVQKKKDDTEKSIINKIG